MELHESIHHYLQQALMRKLKEGLGMISKPGIRYVPHNPSAGVGTSPFPKSTVGVGSKVSVPYVDSTGKSRLTGSGPSTNPGRANPPTRPSYSY